MLEKSSREIGNECSLYHLSKKNKQVGNEETKEEIKKQKLSSFIQTTTRKYSMIYNTIITHEYPDLDAMLCCYLLKKYGKEKYPGIESAQIQFYPAGRLPDNKLPSELEEDGILAVDIGGGRLDTHPQGNTVEEEKLCLSAANLVARDLEVHTKESLINLLEFTRLQDSTGQSLKSRNPVDHTVSMPNIIKGALIYYGNNFHDMISFFMKVFEAIEYAQDSPSNPFVKNANFACYVSNDSIYIPSVLDLRHLLISYTIEKFLNKKWDKVKQDKTYKVQDNFASFIKTLGLSCYNELQKILMYVQQIGHDSYLLNSNRETDETVSLKNIIKGFYYLKNKNIEDIYPLIFCLFECIIAFERDWNEAIDEYKEKKELYEVDKVKFVAIKASRGAVVKVARWQDRADMIVYQDEKHLHISISINRTGRLRNYKLKRLASRLRIAEVFYGGIDKEEDQEYTDIGEIATWFLHQSEKLLVHGSQKAYRPPSKIPFDIITQLIITELKKGRKLPEAFCPEDSCTYNQCKFYQLRLPNCFSHRENIRKNE